MLNLQLKRYTQLVTPLALGLVLLTFGVGCARKLTVRSEPSEAEVFLNGASVGKTPLEIPFSQLPDTANLKLEVKKQDYGTFSGFLPGPSSTVLSSDLLVAIPKTEDDVAKYNQAMNITFKAQRLSKRRTAEALRLVEDAIKDTPRFAALHLARASILFIAKNYDGAAQAYQKVLELDATNPEASKMVAYLKQRSVASFGAEEPGSSSEKPELANGAAADATPGATVAPEGGPLAGVAESKEERLQNLEGQDASGAVPAGGAE